MDQPLEPIPYEDLDDCLAKKDQDGVPFEKWRKMCHVLMYLSWYHETGNPADAAKTYVEALDMGLVPPRELMEWVADSFDSMLACPDGKPDVASAFGLKATRGQTPPFRKRREQVSREALLSTIATLIPMFSLSVENACEMELLRNEWLYPDAILPSCSTLIDEYYRQRRDTLGDKESNYLSMVNELGHRLPSLQQDTLKKYPSHALPADLKKRFSHQ